MHKYLLKHISSGKDLNTSRFLIHDVVLFSFNCIDRVNSQCDVIFNILYKVHLIICLILDS